MDFKSDSFMYGLGICIVLFVIAQSVFFLVRAVRRAKALGIETSTVKKPSHPVPFSRLLRHLR